MKTGNKALTFLAGTVVFLCLLGGNCEKKNPAAQDPLKEKAKEKYTEGRRLFLTCDPNNFPKAIQLLDDALAYWDEYPEANATWAETVSMWYGIMLPEDTFQTAYNRAQRAIRLAPDSDMGYRAMADLFRHRRDPATGKYNTDQALQVIERALTIAPDSAENLYVKGSILLVSDPEKAAGVLEQARQANPNLAKTYFNLASALQLLGDGLRAKSAKDPEQLKANQERIKQYYEKAEESLKAYQTMVPGDLAGYCSLGIIYLHEEKYAEAETEFQKTISLNPNPDKSQYRWRYIAYLQLALIAENKHQDLAGAKTFLARALETSPKDFELLKQLIRLCRTMKDQKCAEDYKKQLGAAIEEAKTAQQKAAEEAKKAREEAMKGMPGTVPGATAPGTAPGSTASAPIKNEVIPVPTAGNTAMNKGATGGNPASPAAPRPIPGGTAKPAGP